MKLKLRMLVPAAALLLSSLVFADSDWSTPAAKALPDGIQALVEGGQYDQAITELTTFVKKEKRNADAWNLLGYSQRKVGMLDESLVSYKKALKVDRKHLGAHEYIGELYLLRDDPKSAKKHLGKLKRYCKDCEEYQELAEAIEKYEQGG